MKSLFLFLLLFSHSVLCFAKDIKLDKQRATLLDSLRLQCLKNFEDEKKDVQKKWCDCILEYHQKYTDDKGVQILIEIYGGSNKYATPNITDDISTFLNNDADIVEKCEKNPKWLKK
ncbi:MAG: hypothetical protein H6623_06980 [Bdellovibrionaceae bacterium]|nr:hypothetical protein [Pseudobdellovibrionaceae bacterium]